MSVGNDCIDYHFPEALYLQGVADTYIWLLARLAEDIAHRAAGCPLACCLDLDVHHVRPDDGRVNDGGHGTRVMHRRGGKAIVEAVGISEEGEEVSYKGCYRATSSTQRTTRGTWAGRRIPTRAARPSR